MVQFVAMSKETQVNGTTIMSIVDGLGIFKYITERVFNEAGLPNPDEIVPDVYHWYSQQKWLDAFKIIAEKVGSRTLFRIGLKIPENAVFPPQISDIESALQSIDVAYHANHKNYGPDELGHYQYSKVPGENKILITCDNPYPCDFDRGIITAIAKRLNHSVRVNHAYGKCRKSGEDSCTYTVTW
ncbi:MAG: hypothetical protein ACXAEU_13205 [Candidatus Hodarchaeales archaeon]|jgi:hypothetical protein